MDPSPELIPEASTSTPAVTTTSLSVSRQRLRRSLRPRAAVALRSILGTTALSRRSMRTVARAYANAAYRTMQKLPEPARTRYSHYQGKRVVLNAALTDWIADV